MVKSTDQASKQQQLLNQTSHGPQLSTNSKMSTMADVIDVTDLASSPGLLEEAIAASGVLKEANCRTCALQNAAFRELKSLLLVKNGDLIQDLGNFVFAVPQYSLLRVHDDKISEHDHFSVDDMNAIVQLCESVLKPWNMVICSVDHSSLESGTESCRRSLKKRDNVRQR